MVGRSPEHANVVVLGGFSGHGFKFAPIIGDIAADLAIDGHTPHPIDLFRPARFRTPAAGPLPTGAQPIDPASAER